jgi:azurin
MQHHLRDPNRDHDHGRIYRITYEGRPLTKPRRIDGQPLEALFALLKEPENQTRELARIELGKHAADEVVAALKRWVAGLDPKDHNHEHHLTEALWVHQWLNAPNSELLGRLLHSPEPRARTAGARVLCYWRDRIPNAIDTFKTLADDESPRVRLEAVRAASFFRSVEAADAALIALKHPTDYYLDYTLRETLRQLQPLWRKALETGQPMADGNPNGRAFLLRTIRTPELAKLPRSPMILQAILTRADAVDADRMVALGELAKIRGTNLVAVLIAELQLNLKAGPRQMPEDPSAQNEIAALARLLPYQVPANLKPFRLTLSDFAHSGVSPELRQTAWAALALADDGFDALWKETKSEAALADLLNGIPFLTDSAFRAKAYDKVKPMISQPNPVLRAAIYALVSMNQEPEVTFAALSALIQKGVAVQDAARGLAVLPRTKWPRKEAGVAANGLVAWAKTVPASGRTAQDYGEIVQLAGDLAGLMPAEQAADLRQQLKELRVALFVVRTVREQMRYDTPRLVVEAGKPFEIIFENADFMPHNLILVKPNARSKIGLAAAGMKPDEVDGEGRHYLPNSPDVLGGSKMLEPGQRESLKLTAPADEGQCEYFCTFPGHYQVMWGRLVVTKDVDAYLRANPEAPAALPDPGAQLDHAGHSHPGEE